MGKNEAIIKRGIRIAEKLIENQMLSAGRMMALIALRDAVKAYDANKNDKNLTGNTRTGFCSAVFWKGKLNGKVYNVFDLAAQPMHPTSGMTKVGEKGFRDYDYGERIGTKSNPSVKEYSNPDYSFLPTMVGQYAYELTENWIKSSYRPSRKDSMIVVVANVSPYINFLHEVRGMDILETESDYGNIQAKLISSFGMQEKL